MLASATALSRSRVWVKYGEQVLELSASGDRVGQRLVRPHGVVVTAAASLAREIAGGGQFGHDAVRGTLRDPNPVAEVAQPDRGILRDRDEGLRVVGEETPVRHSCFSILDF